MATKINANTTRTALEEAFQDDSAILETISSLLTFGAAAAAGEPVSFAAGLALIAKSAASAVKACSTIVKRIGHEADNEVIDILPKYDRFRIVFFVTCQKSYIEALGNALKGISIPKNSDCVPKDETAKTADFQVVKSSIELALANLNESEVSYLFSVEPLDDDVPLFDAFGKWFANTLTYYGITNGELNKTVKKADQEARERFHLYLASEDANAIWMRNFLALSQQSRSKRIAGDLSSIRQTLENWTSESTTLKTRQQEAWSKYRAALRELPDSKETMFNEQFGVRKVFVQPAVAYHIIGLEGDASKPKIVPDFGRLFGALLSTRASGEDLIIMCGGPGSGKSTLCRILASELAADPKIHPIFLRLRRLKEGSDISVFIETSLRNQGLVSHISDLRDISNLVLILDGFDELVMASRSRLRHFFNLLKEEMSVGPLREAKIIISGRDTLFPNGDGLPNGSHVVSLQAFDGPRIKLWGEKWRAQHKLGIGKSFKPELLHNDKETGTAKSPLFHLVSWPLTLHLVARVHASGNLEFEGKKSHEVEKAYLYRSILADTAKRQIDQAQGKGRLMEKEMRIFLRDLAWEMYSKSVDSMDPAEVIPLLSKYFPDTNEAEIAELGDVAVVNAPELTKGEQTGFEFVHKSFAEYLVAEQLADCIERVSFKAPEYGTDDLTWRMTEHEATLQLAPMIGIRLLTEEVQEMIEPMLGCLTPFLKGDKVNDVISAPTRTDGLARIIDRFESLYAAILQGKSLDVVNHQTKNKLLIHSALEAYANFCAGVLIIGAASARRLNYGKDKEEHRHFNCEPFKGAFWRALFMLQAGGQNIDTKLADRLLQGCYVDGDNPDSIIGDRTFPMHIRNLAKVEGYDSEITTLFAQMMSAYEGAYCAALLAVTLLGHVLGESTRDFNRYIIHRFPGDLFHDEPIAALVRILTEAGIVNMSDIETYSFGGRRPRELGFMVERIIDRPDSPEYLDELMYHIDRFITPRSGPPGERYLLRAIRDMSRLVFERRRTGKRKMSSSEDNNPKVRKSDNEGSSA